MRDMGMDPKDYGSKWEDPKNLPDKKSEDPFILQDDDTSETYVSKKSKHNNEEEHQSIGEVLKRANHELFQLDFDSGLYTINELREKYGDELTEEELHDLIQEEIDSGLYTKKEIMDKYGLDEFDLALNYYNAFLLDDVTDTEDDNMDLEETDGKILEIQLDLDSDLLTEEVKQNNRRVLAELLGQSSSENNELMTDDPSPDNKK